MNIPTLSLPTSIKSQIQSMISGDFFPLKNVEKNSDCFSKLNGFTACIPNAKTTRYLLTFFMFHRKNSNMKYLYN
jgi:hypothetical protein